MSTNMWNNIQIVVYLYSGILLSNVMENLQMLSESSKKLKKYLLHESFSMKFRKSKSKQ